MPLLQPKWVHLAFGAAEDTALTLGQGAFVIQDDRYLAYAWLTPQQLPRCQELYSDKSPRHLYISLFSIYYPLMNNA
jgi:hypothetical protein